MKKWITLLYVSVFLLFLSACEGTTDNAVIEYRPSVIFSELEIKSAMDAVLVNFKDYRDCDLKKLWYEDVMCMHHIEMYMTYGKGSVNGVEENNVIILLGEFDVGENAAPYFAGEAVINWKWILIRKSAADEWIVDDAGWVR